MRYKLSSFIILAVLMVTSLASAAVSITTSDLPAATVGTAYTANLTASGGSAPYSWTAHKVPAGLSFTKDGVLSGTPTAASSRSLHFSVKDAKKKSAHKSLSLAIARPPAVPTLTLTSSVPSPQIPGQAVTFTAGMANGSGSYEYQFMYVDPVYPTLLLTAQQYSSVNTWTMNTSNNPYRIGTYKVQVNIRKTGSSAAYDYTGSLSYTLVAPPAPTGLTLRSSLASPQESGKHIWFTAKTATGSSYAQYRISVKYPDGSVHLVMPVAGNPPDTFTWGDINGECSGVWNSFGLPAGNYEVSVFEKSSYSSAAYDLTTSMTYTLTPSSVVLPPTDPYKYGKVLFEKGTEANPAGYYYVLGATFIAKYDIDWNLIWNNTTTGASEKAFFDAAGNICFLANASFKKIDKDGNILVNWKIPGLGSNPVYTADSNNNVYVAWITQNAGAGTTVTVVKHDANGNQLWNWQATPEFVVPPTGMSNGPTTAVSGIALDGNGNVYVSGSTPTINVRFAGVVGQFVLKFDTTGNQLANLSVQGANGKLFPDAQGNYTTIGTELATPGFNAALDITKFDVNGAIIWQKQLLPAAPGFSLIVRDYVTDKDGNFFILTSPILPNTPKVITNQYPGIAITKLDSTGNILWAATGGTTPEEWIYPLTLSVDDSGNMYVKSSTTVPNGNYYALIKFDQNGKQMWMK